MNPLTSALLDIVRSHAELLVPPGGWDEEPEPIARAPEDDAADDAGCPRQGPL